jgi:HEAT repeat protein
VETTQTYTLLPVNLQLDDVLREVRDLVAGSSISAEVTRPSDPITRQLVAEQLLAAMSGPDLAAQERARKIFIKHGYLDETTNKFRSADSASDRAAAAHTLGIVGSHLATAHLIAGIFDSEPEVSRAAAEALARIGDPAVSMGPLNTLINTPSDQTATDRSKFAAPSYLRIQPELVEREQSVEFEDTVESERSVASERTVEFEQTVESERSVESGRSVEFGRSVEYRPVTDSDTADLPAEIVAGLTSLLSEERVEALAQLTQSGAKATFKLIVDSFADVSPDVRNAAARALYELDPDHSAEPFGRAIEESSVEQGRNIGIALAASGVACRAIEDLGGDSREDAYNSLCLLFAMAKTGEIRPLIKAIEEHPSGEVRRAAVKLLTLNGQSEVDAAAAKRRLMAPVK